jgi:hypothetical protein
MAQESMLREFAQMLQSGQLQFKHDSPTGTPSSPYMHGPGGLFGEPGLERDIISTRVQPQGIAGMLPARGSLTEYPLFPYITGFQDVTGSNPDGVCDEPQTAGPIKSCYQTADFGRYSYTTRELDIDRVGRRTNRGEFMDLRIMNDPLLRGNDITVPGSADRNPNLAREVLVRFMEVGVAFQNKLARQIYTGNPANNTGGGGYKEFPGLDILISTGKIDAKTGQSCPSLDPDIKNFNYQRLDLAGAGTLIVNQLTYLTRYTKHNAQRMGFGETRWVLAMRQALFWELTAVWPCAYLTYRCAPNANNSETLFIDANDQIRMRDEMRAGSYLVIDGERYPVIIDDGITEETNTTTASVTSGCFASDIYLIPLTVMGGNPVTYWEYVDYQGENGAMQAVADGNLGDSFWSDGGRYLWHKEPPLRWCVRWDAKIEPRLVLLTPHLAGRLLNVQYCPLQHERTPFPGDPYFVDGGVTSRSGPSLWHDWTAS